MKYALIAASVLLAPAATAEAPASPAPEPLADGVHLVRGAMLPERGPDGNTVIFDAPEGLVVVDTGRHAWHSDAILALARQLGRPVAAIVNTHWHLDHSSGNGRIRQAHPGARVHTTGAVDRALADGGFLARNLESAKPRLEDPSLSGVQREEVQIFVRTMEESENLRPDVALETSGMMRIAGRELDVRITDHAVTDADVWLHDPETGIAVLGDLVTLPAPFFETACPDRWRTALAEVSETSFRLAIPGHGEPMSRARFESYRQAFGSFMDCVQGDAPAGDCAAAWSTAVEPLLGGDERMRRMSGEYAGYYVELLRRNGGRSAECLVD